MEAVLEGSFIVLTIFCNQ